jgi:rhamnulokinase
MVNYCLAIDIGASSGRHILGHLDHGRLQIEEVHRFENGMKNIDGQLCWDLDRLFHEILVGMKKCKTIGKIPTSVGIDTWGVDFVLLDQKDHRIGNAVAYRDDRTIDMDQLVYSFLSEEQLYHRTGIQKQSFNTIYQLMAVKKQHPEYLVSAENIVMIPDYFHFLLSGIKRCEYTNATTTQLVSPMTKDWDRELIRLLGYPEKIFPRIEVPGTYLGYLTKEIQDEIGYDCKVILPATHDTGSAILAVPTKDNNPLYISSGTWSLMGTERSIADCSLISKQLNFSNEGGFDYRFRYLKNIMGLWMIQSVKKEIGNGLSFSDICNLASEESIPSIINCNDNRFLSPDNMTSEVKKACNETNQPIPEGIGQVAAVIYNSLAFCYQNTVRELEEMSIHTFDSLHIVGGGSNAEYLNDLTARFTGKTVYAGPTEATAIGNIIAQMISLQVLPDLSSARECVMKSFDVKKYESNPKTV